MANIGYNIDCFLNEDDFDDVTAKRLLAMLQSGEANPKDYIDRATTEIRRYIHRRYDCDAIFSARRVMVARSYETRELQLVRYGATINIGSTTTIVYKVMASAPSTITDGWFKVTIEKTTFTDSRNVYVVGLAVDIATYLVWTTNSTATIGADELAAYKMRYEEAIDALKMIAAGRLDIDGLDAFDGGYTGEQSAGGFCNFINPEDYDASIHAEILDSLIRANAATLETCEDRAVSEMRSYMRLRYDCDAIFEARGLGRHPLVLMRAIDIAIYHAFCIHNPQKMSTLRLKRYDDAIAWLKEVQTGAAVIDGAPTLEASIVAANGYYRMQSNAKRNSRV